MLNVLDATSRVLIPILLQLVLYSTILFVVILVLATVLRKRSPLWHFGLWVMVFIRLVLPPNLSLPISGRNLVSQFPIANQTFALISKLVSVRSMSSNPGNSFKISTDTSHLPSAQQQTVGPGTWKQNTPSWQVIAFLLWLSGLSALLLLYLSRLNKYHRLVKQSSPVQDPAANKILQVWQSRFRIRRQIRLVSSDHHLSPFTSGIFRPIIYLPKCLVDAANPQLLQSIIAHELTHIKRFDEVWLRFQNMIQIIYFFHPVVWVANSRLNLARECICDNLVLSKHKISAETYGNGILAVLKLNLIGPDSLGLMPDFGGERKKITYRIQNLKRGGIVSKNHLILVFACLTVLGLLLLPMAYSSEKNLQKGDSEQTTAIESARDKTIDFVLPIRNGYISSKFGIRINPVTREEQFHNATDIAAKRGTKVFAAADGTVLSAISDYEPNRGHGKNIVLQHADGYKTRYAALDTIYVQEGQSVKAGDCIGMVGNTGVATGLHLHFELSKGGEHVNPEDHIDFEDLKAD